MWSYTVTDESGKEYILTFDHEPTQAEIQARIESEIWSSGKGAITQGLEKIPAFGIGLGKGTVSAGADIYSLLGATGKALGLDAAGQWFDEGADAAAGWERGMDKYVRETMPDARGTYGAGSITSQVLPMIVPAWAVSKIASAPRWAAMVATGAAAGTQSGAGYLRQARGFHEAQMAEDGFREKYPDVTEEDIEMMAIGRAAPWAILSGVKTSALTVLGGHLGSKIKIGGASIGAGPEAIAAQTSRGAQHFGQTGWQGLGRASAIGGVEATEEVIDEAVQIAIDKYTINESMGWGDVKERLLTAAGAGFVFGASMHGAARYDWKVAQEELNISQKEADEAWSEQSKADILSKVENSLGKNLAIRLSQQFEVEQGTAARARAEFFQGPDSPLTQEQKSALAKSERGEILLTEEAAAAREALQIIESTAMESELGMPLTVTEQQAASRMDRSADQLRKAQAIQNLKATLETAPPESVDAINEKIAQIALSAEPVPDAAVQKLLDEMGVTSVKEAYDMIVAGETPAQLEFVGEAVTNLEAEQDGQQEAITEMEEAAAKQQLELEDSSSLLAKKRERLLAPKVSREFQQEEGLPTSTNSMLGMRKAARAGRPDTSPEFTGPTAVADAGPSVGRPDVPSVEADLDFLGPKSPLTQRQQSVLKKASEGTLLTGEEVKVRDEALRILEESKPQPKSKSTKEMGRGVLQGPITKAEKTLLKRGEEGKLKRGEHWSLKRLKKKLEKTRASRGGRLPMSFFAGADIVAINSAIDAAIVATNAGMKVDEALESALKAMEDAGFHISKVNHNDAKREMAGILSDRISEIEGDVYPEQRGWESKTMNERFDDLADAQRGTPEMAMYDVHDAVKGLLSDTTEHAGDLTHRMAQDPSFFEGGYTWVKEKVDRLYRRLHNEYGFEKEAYVENVEAMAKYHKKPVKKVREEVDAALKHYAESHKKLKTYNDVQTKARDLAVALGERRWNDARTLVSELKEHTDKGREHWEKVALEDFTPFKATKAKLKKIRDSLRKYRKSGRVSLGGLDIGGAAVLDAAFTVTLKAMEAGDTLATAMQKGYDTLGSTEVSKARFENYMGKRMLFAVDELDKGVSLEDAVKSSGLPFGGKTTVEMIDMLAEVEEGKKNGIPPPTTKIANLDGWFKRSIGAFWGKGTADVMEEGENSLAFMSLGSRMKDHVDKSDEYVGRLQAMLLDSGTGYIEAGSWLSKVRGKETPVQKRASDEWEDYQRKLFRTKERPDISHYSELGQTLIKGWRKVAAYTGDEMVDADLKVTGEGMLDGKPNKKKRDFKRLGEDFWMRGYAPKYAKPLRELQKGKKLEGHRDAEVLQEIGDILLKYKEIKSVTADNIFNWYNRGRLAKRSLDFTGYAEQDSFFDFLGRGREKGDPIEELMDFSFGAAKRYIYNWSERMAQIHAYGQELKSGKDLFQIAIDKFSRENNNVAKRLVEKARKDAYQQQETDDFSIGLAVVNKTATLLMLTGGFNAIRNLTGVGVTTSVYGVQNSLKAFAEMRNYAEAAKTSRAWGVLRDDMSLLLSGQDASAEGALDMWTKGGLEATGFSPAENFVRIHAAMTAKIFAVEGVGAVNEGKTRLADEFKRMAERMDVDWESIVKENSPDGVVTQRFIRRAVKEVQGGYRFDQLPAFMSTPIGKLMFKFGAYSFQVSRAVKRNVLEERSKGNYWPLLRLLAIAGQGSGELLYELRRLLYGKEKPHATFAEIRKAGIPKSFEELINHPAIDRMVNNMAYAGTLGFIGDLAGTTRAVQMQQRVKNPLDPAGLETPNQLFRYITKPLYTKELWTFEDAKELVQNISAFWRYNSALVLEQSANIGVEWDAAELQRAKDDRNALRFATRRFQLSVGDDVKNLTSRTDYKEGEFTAELRDIKDALMIGDVFAARKAAVVFAQDLPLEKREKAWSRISQSIQASQPMKIGDSYSREIKDEFIEWARRNLDEEQFMQVMSVQDRYMGAAANAGLIGAAEDSLEREMKIILNLKAPASRGGRSSGRTISREQLLDNRIRNSGGRGSSRGREITREELLRRQ